MTSTPAVDRDRILSENLRLHRSTAAIYDSVHPHMRNSFEQGLQTRDIRRMVRSFLPDGSPHVLELGCGTGNLTVGFLEQGAHVTAVDMSSEMLQVLRSKLDAVSLWRERCQVVESDVDGFVSHMPGVEFHIVAMSSVAHHLPDYLDTLERLARRIYPRGFLYLVHEPAHRRELTRSALAMRRLWSVVPRGADRLLRRTRVDASLHRQWETEDTTFADFHYHRDGVSVFEISRQLAAHGFRLVDVSRYNAHETSLVSWLDNHWCSRLRYEQFQRTYFRGIWQRA